MMEVSRIAVVAVVAVVGLVEVGGRSYRRVSQGGERLVGLGELRTGRRSSSVVLDRRGDRRRLSVVAHGRCLQPRSVVEVPSRASNANEKLN